MENLYKIIDATLGLWGYLVGAVGLVVGGYTFGRKWVASITRAVRFSDAVHREFGSDAVALLSGDRRAWQRGVQIRVIKQQIIESRLGLAIYVCDREGLCESVNEALCGLFGLDSSECIGLGWSRAIVEEDRERVLSLWKKAISNKWPYSADYRVYNGRTHKELNIKTKAIPVIIGGDVWGFVGTLWEDVEIPED